MEVFLSCIALTLLLMIAYALMFLKADKTAIEGFTYWLMFIVFVGLIPVILNSVLAFIRGNDIVMSVLFGKGELLIISLPIGLDASAKLMLSENKNKLIKIIAGGSCLIFAQLSSLIFAMTSETQGVHYDSTRIAIISIGMFIMVTILSGICVYFSEVE